ncbi:hypothetical protein OXX69_007315 [Metschnikowia pulcherrima]
MLWYLQRIPKKLAVSALAAVLLAQIFLLSYFHVFRPSFQLNPTNNAFLPSSKFQQKAAKLLRSVHTNKEKFWWTESALQHLEVEIPANKVFAASGSDGNAELFYDPRLTLAVYLDELRRIGNSAEKPVLPFHWADWADVTYSNTHTENERAKNLSCEDLASRIRGHPDPGSFCKDRNEISEPELEKMGFKSREQLPKTVIHSHCPHKYPAFNDIRVFMAKSYTMTHLPKPFKVIILNDSNSGGTFEFTVDQTQDSNQRLEHNGLAERFAVLKRKVFSRTMFHDDMINFNPTAVYQELVKTVKPRILDPVEDVMNMRHTVKSAVGSNKDLILEKHHFHYPKGSIQTQIDQYEQIQARDVFQQSYLDGLKDCANYNGTNEPTYFKMAVLDVREPRNTRKEGGWHYDWRFFNDALFFRKEGWTKVERAERAHIILERLLRNWNRFAEEKGLVSWIMHGPLLSWFWNGMMFPYDIDVDIQMPISELIRLAKDFNQTLVVENPAEGYGKYLIDVGTYIHNRERSRTGNHIDARFIDVDSGIYIDITGLSKSASRLPMLYKTKPIVRKTGPNDEVYNDRRMHFYTLPQLQPLHYSMMGGVPMYIPNQISARLRWEYEHGLDRFEYRGWFFVPKLQMWITREKLVTHFAKSDYSNGENRFDAQKMVARIKDMSDEDGLRLLQDDEILAEYYLTSKSTDWHEREKSFLFTSDGKDNVIALEDPSTRRAYDDLVGEIGFTKPFRKALYEYEVFDRLSHQKKDELIEEFVGPLEN